MPALGFPTGRDRRDACCRSGAWLLLSGRDGFDDPKRVELRALRYQRSVTARRGIEDVEADLVLRNMDGAVEADRRSLLGQLRGYRARSLLARDAPFGSTLRASSVRERTPSLA